MTGILSAPLAGSLASFAGPEMIRSPDVSDEPMNRDSITDRERAFLIGAPLALIPALAILPAVIFLIAFPEWGTGDPSGL